MSGASRLVGVSRDTPEPRASRDPRRFTLHGDSLSDEFAYLRDFEDPRTREYIEAEKNYFRMCLEALADGRDTIYHELKARIVEDDASVAERIAGHHYFTRVAAGLQYPIHCRRPVEGDGPEEVYLDENRLALEDGYCDVSVVAICPRQSKFAYTVDRTGDERYEIHVASMAVGEHRCVARDAGESLAWSADGRCLLYTRLDDNARPESVWLHDTRDGSHRRLYTEPDAAFYVTVWLSRSGEWLFIDSGSNACSEVRVLPAHRPLAEPFMLIARRDDVEYSVDHHADRFLVLINDTHENFRLLAFRAPPDAGDPGSELIPADDRVTLEYVDAYSSHWVIGELADGVRRIAVMDPASGKRNYLPGSGPLASLEVEDLYEYDADYVRYEYSTPVSPDSVYDYDVGSGRSALRKVVTPPGYENDAYAVERLEAPSGAVQVPLSVLYRRDKAPFGATTPLLLTGYGAYEESADMDFDSDLLSLLDRGVVVATAHVRGGGDLGPGWHDAGRMAEKENSFSDFLACADYLVRSGYTGPGRIAAWGASAGGLLVAVAAQRQPGLFASVVLEVPFLDVLNTLLDTDLPLTEHDFDEFGDPSVEEEYRWIRAYSPYDNIREQVYPPMLITTAMKDQRVGYWEALKWTARLRATRLSDNPLLLNVDEAGHLGRSGRYEMIEETAIVYTFLLDMWGLTVERK